MISLLRSSLLPSLRPQTVPFRPDEAAEMNLARGTEPGGLMRAEEKEEARERGEEWSPKGGVERGRGGKATMSCQRPGRRRSGGPESRSRAATGQGHALERRQRDTRGRVRLEAPCNAVL